MNIVTQGLLYKPGKSKRKTNLAKSKQTKPEIYVDYGDVHFPDVHWPTFHALCDFLKHNKVEGFIFGGDQFDNACVSHHNSRKPKLLYSSDLETDEVAFDEQILKPIEKLLSPNTEKVWIDGNHDYWLYELYQQQPNLGKKILRQNSLKLKDRGWKYLKCGEHFQKGKLTVIHGEQLSGFGNQSPTGHSKKALEVYGQNVLYHHFHQPQSATKIMPFNEEHKYMAWCSPCGCNKNPEYLRNRGTAWLSGFTIILYWGDKGFFNLFPCVVVDGKFAFGDRIYGA